MTKSNTFKGSNNTNNDDNRLRNSKNEQINKKKLNLAEEGNIKESMVPISDKANNKNLDKFKEKVRQDIIKNIKKKESKKDVRPDSKPKNINISDSFPNNNSFIQSDIEEIKSIFDPKDLKKNGINSHSLEASKLFENSEEKEEISLKDLDPKIKDVLILFVLSSDYYELLVQERAKKAFNFSKKNKK